MEAKIDLSLTPGDLNVILMALGQLPYVQVHELIGRIQAEAGPQLLAASEAEKERPRGEEPPSR